MGAVWNAEARQNVSKRQGGVFPIWNQMPLNFNMQPSTGLRFSA